MSQDVIKQIIASHKTGEVHAEIARRLGVSRQYVGSVVRSRKLKPRSEILEAQRDKARKQEKKDKAKAKLERSKPHLTPMAERLSTLWQKKDYSVADIARELSTTPESVMKTASLYRRDFPKLFPRRVGGRRKQE